MKYRLVLIMFIAVLLMGLGSAGLTKEQKKKPAKTPEYVGAKKCKMCHKTEHKSWLETKHAKAYETLKPEDRKKDSCTVCHITGFGVADTVFEGIQCEACHGPGSLYKSPKIMSKKKYKDNREAQHKLALEAGLIVPDEETCTGCHNKKSPTFKSFDYAKMKLTGVHALKKAAVDTTKAEGTGG